MQLVQIIGIIFAAAVILILAYLYRESAIIEGKTEVSIGPVKFKLGGKAQKPADAPEEPAEPFAPKIEQTAKDWGRITRSGPEIQRDAGEIKQEASGGGVIEDSPPKIS